MNIKQLLALTKKHNIIWQFNTPCSEQGHIDCRQSKEGVALYHTTFLTASPIVHCLTEDKPFTHKVDYPGDMYHFKSKEELCAALTKHVANNLIIYCGYDREWEAPYDKEEVLEELKDLIDFEICLDLSFEGAEIEAYFEYTKEILEA